MSSPNTYQTRNALLLSLGYATYAEYLASPLWQGIKDRGFAHYGRVCHLCGKGADVLHHLGYGRDVLVGQSLRQLVPLCHACHENVEFAPGRRKRSLSEAQAMFTHLLRTGRKVSRSKPGIGRCSGCQGKAGRGKRRCRFCLRLDAEYGEGSTITLTFDLLERGRGRKGRYTQPQLEALGTTWTHDWMTSFIGKEVPRSTFVRFLTLKGAK